MSEREPASKLQSMGRPSQLMSFQWWTALQRRSWKNLTHVVEITAQRVCVGGVGSLIFRDSTRL